MPWYRIALDIMIGTSLLLLGAMLGMFYSLLLREMERIKTRKKKYSHTKSVNLPHTEQ